MPIKTKIKSDVRFNVMRFAAKGIFLLLLFVSCATAIHAQAIEIKLVDGKTGHAFTSIPWLAPHTLDVDLGRESDLSLVLTTDKLGLVLLRFSRNDNEINVPDCRGEHAAWDKLVKDAMNGIKNKEDVKAFNKKYRNCANFRVKNPVVRFVDSILIGRIMGSNFQYVQCWAEFPTSFSTEDILQHGVVTANNCSKASASPEPGQLILFVRLPTQMEAGRQAWN
jgi:hypothetical protein